MRRPLPLPPKKPLLPVPENDVSSPVPPRPATAFVVNKSENPLWAGDSATTSRTIPGETLYLIKVKLQNSPNAAFVTLTHQNQMKQAELDEILADVAKVVNEVRIPNRRKEMAKNMTPVPDPHAMNATAFPWDVEFFEAVMCDKYGFRRVLTMNGNAEIEKTAKV